MIMKPGTLYGVGVGPGDPELITLKAMKILNQVEVIFAAASSKNEYSLALENAKSHMLNGAEVVRLSFPMTREQETLERAWEENARRILEFVQKGKDAEVPVHVIPGVTSYQAATAAAHEIVAEREETFCVISGAKGGEQLKEMITKVDCVVMLKVYRHFDKILDTLEELGIQDRAVLVSRCGMEDQVICKNPQELRGKKVPYLSLMIVKRRKES
jgi:precorrin-2/cobalt-factor-2 C20-methyltransferase